MAFKFENLRVWEQAVDLSGEISETVKKFPKNELFVLTSQIKRAADSISLKIFMVLSSFLSGLIQSGNVQVVLLLIILTFAGSR